MIQIRFPISTPQIKEWKEKLNELVVAHQFEMNTDLDLPQLVEKDTKLEGEEAINLFIDQLEKDIIEWRKPGCGK